MITANKKIHMLLDIHGWFHKKQQINYMNLHCPVLKVQYVRIVHLLNSVHTSMTAATVSLLAQLAMQLQN